MPHITTPILYVSGKHDEIVPTEMTQRLFDASTRARTRKQWVNKDGYHNDSWFINKEMYMQQVTSFMTQSNSESKVLR